MWRQQEGRKWEVPKWEVPEGGREPRAASLSGPRREGRGRAAGRDAHTLHAGSAAAARRGRVACRGEAAACRAGTAGPTAPTPGRAGRARRPHVLEQKQLEQQAHRFAPPEAPPAGGSGRAMVSLGPAPLPRGL